MVIDKIGSINNITETAKPKHTAETKSSVKNDSVQISSEAKVAAERARYIQIAKDAPVAKSDNFADIKERVQNGTYDFNDAKVLGMVADKILGSLLK